MPPKKDDDEPAVAEDVAEKVTEEVKNDDVVDGTKQTESKDATPEDSQMTSSKEGEAQDGKPDEENNDDAAKEEEKDDELKDDELKDDDMEDAKDDDGRESEVPADEKPDKDPSPPREPEKPKELEEDAPDDDRPRLQTNLCWSDTTLNVMPTCDGNVLMSLCEGGFQYLLAGARSSSGIKSGRYMFEVKIVEMRMPVESSGGKGAQPIPPQMLCLGFTDGESSLFISDEEASIGFDSEGNYITSKFKGFVTKRFQLYEVFAVLLNLDPNSPNNQTVSLFRDGVRVSEPKPLPDSLKGKALFPTVNFRNMTLHANFGPTPLVPLPFSCRMVKDAAEADTVANKLQPVQQCEVVLPIGLPDEATFDWLDGFLRENPEYVEVSDRAILEWARKSGLVRPRGFSQRACNDRPGMEFGIREMDDLSVRRLIRSVAPVLRRKYVIMEVRNNLLVAQRKKVLEHFHSDFKKTAIVAMGEPPQDFKKLVHESLLSKKRERAVQDAKLEFEKAKKAKVNDSEPKKGDKPKDEGENKAEGEEGKDEDQDKAEEKIEDNGKEVEESLDDVISKAEKVELNEEEAGTWFRKPVINDLTTKDLANSFANFCLPTRAEGFDEIKFSWQPEDDSAKYLKKWIAEQKLIQKVEDLQPGSWFQEQTREWQNLLQRWHKIQGDFQDKQKNKQRKPKDETTKDSESKEPDEKKDGEAKEEKAEDAMEINVSDLDCFLVDDICDVGNSEPLFTNFAFEDWEMLKLRFELHTLVHAFRRDLNDVERPSFHESHLLFYYTKYFKTQLTPNRYGVDAVGELIELVSDTMEVLAKNSILEPQLSDDTPFDIFVRLTEDERRRRQRRIDSGCESAALKVQRNPPSGGAQAARGGYNQRGQQQRGGYNQPQRGGYNQPPRSTGSGGGGYSRGPPPNTSRPPPTSRTPPQSSGYGSNTSRSGGYGGSSYGSGSRGSTYGGSTNSYGGSGSRSYGGNSAPPSRGYGAPAPAPPARSYGGSSGTSYGGSGGGAQKRPYPSSSSNPPPSKYPRGSGSYGGSAGSGSRSYGSGGGSSHSGGYRR